MSACIVNLTWTVSEDDSCPLTKYTIYYRHEKSSWNKIEINKVSVTSHQWSLRCDTLYEFAVSAWNDVGQSNFSATWRKKTQIDPGKTGKSLYNLLCIKFILAKVGKNRDSNNINL